MKHLLIVVLPFFFIFKIYGQAVIEAESRLAAVTVYPEQAQLEYTGTLSLPAGESKVVLTGLSPDLVSGSIQLKLSEAGVSIEEISSSKNYLKRKEFDQEVARLTLAQDSLQKIATWCNQKREILNEEEKVLQTNRQVYSQKSGVTASALKELMNVYGEELTRIRKARLENNNLHKKIENEINALKNQINKLYNGSWKSVSEVRIALSSKAALKLNYSLFTMVSNASWKPVYDIRATSVDAPLLVSFRAIVRQSTGENWKDVKLLISTAQPALDNRQPVLAPSFARILPPTTDTVIANEAVTYAERMEIVQNKAREEVWSDKEYNLTSSTFALTSNQSVPSDGGDHYFAIRDITIPARIQHYAAPRASPHVYLLAEIVNNSDYDLRSGIARIYNGSTFVGETKINIETLQDTLQLSLGIDQGVYVKRERRDFGANQWLGTYRQETFDFSIGIRNSKKTPVEVKLLDQIPISTDKQIEISLLKNDNADYAESSGMLTWQVRCAPGSTEMRTFSYKVKYPKEAVVGGKW